jgi:hypothetical protein
MQEETFVARRHLMNETQRCLIGELKSSAQGLSQLASWQLALAREIESKLAELATMAGPSAAQQVAQAPRRRRSPGPKGPRTAKGK